MTQECTNPTPDTALIPDTGPCPPWCSLPAGHGWDCIEFREGVESRVHQGLTFGSVLIESVELSDAVGAHRPVANFDGEKMGRQEWDAADLRRLSVDCLAAAEYLDSHSGEPE